MFPRTRQFRMRSAMPPETEASLAERLEALLAMDTEPPPSSRLNSPRDTIPSPPPMPCSMLEEYWACDYEDLP